MWKIVYEYVDYTPGRLIGAMSCPVGVVGGNKKAPGKFGDGRAAFANKHTLYGHLEIQEVHTALSCV